MFLSKEKNIEKHVQKRGLVHSSLKGIVWNPYLSKVRPPPPKKKKQDLWNARGILGYSPEN